NYSFSSTSDEALEAGYITPEGYAAIDYILGMEKDDPNARPLFGQRYKTFSPEMQRIIRAYTAIGGNIFVSGAYIGYDMQGTDETRFTQNVLKYQFGAQHRSGNNTFGATGMNRTVQVPSTLNAQSFAVCSADILTAVGDAFSAMVYTDTRESAAVAYKGNDYHTFSMGFPFEAINDPVEREHIMASILRFLINRD
ncbi:MAG: xanthan lyase, partial [Bacteroidaceae bacterium]|nr:xanthan lyase [Bacteroidaceae bacterium]